MDENARRIFDEAFTTLDRVAHVEVEHRSYHDDPLTRWAASMPKPEPQPTPQPRTMTDAEEINQLRAADWARFVDSRIERALAEHDVIRNDEIGKALAAERRRMRGEIQTAVAKAQMNTPANEFFYVDDAGVRQDAELHGPILRAVDNPVDEGVMGPIRAKHRGRWLELQKARRRG